MIFNTFVSSCTVKTMTGKQFVQANSICVSFTGELRFNRYSLYEPNDSNVCFQGAFAVVKRPGTF